MIFFGKSEFWGTPYFNMGFGDNPFLGNLGFGGNPFWEVGFWENPFLNIGFGRNTKNEERRTQPRTLTYPNIGARSTAALGFNDDEITID